MQYSTREMLESDITECAKLIVDTYQHDGIWLDWTIEDTIRDLKIPFDNPKYKEKYFVAVLDNEIIGVAGVAESFMTCSVFELCYATVKPKYQRKGVGTGLTMKRIEYIKSFRKHGSILTSSRFPDFFTKLAFKRVGDDLDEDDIKSGIISEICIWKF